VLTEKLEIKRLDFLDVVRDQIDGEKEDAEALFNAEFALMTGELAHLLPAVVQALGGEIAVAAGDQKPLEAASSQPEAKALADDPPF
jgi:recombination associated protein RdgC